MHQGVEDDVCPVAWSRRTVREVRNSGGRARLHTYRAPSTRVHGSDWHLMMRRMVAACG